MYQQRFKSLKQRFTEKYGVLANGCWQWKSVTHYPRFYVDGRYVKAHRFAWETANARSLQAGQVVCHSCDNPRCVNPAHLFMGTQQDNMRDRASKGRYMNGGVRNGRALLNPDLVSEIRRRYAAGGISQDALAKEYGVGQMTISHVVRRDSWREATDG